MHAKRLLALGPVALIYVPFGGHETIRLISEGGRGRPLIQRCVEERDIDATSLRAIIRVGRARSPTYASTLLVRPLGGLWPKSGNGR